MDLLPWAVPSGVSFLVSLAVILIYKGRLVPRTEVERMERDKHEQFAIYERIINIYKEADATKQETINTLTDNIGKMADNQKTTNHLIQGLVDAAATARHTSTLEGST